MGSKQVPGRWPFVRCEAQLAPRGISARCKIATWSFPHRSDAHQETDETAFNIRPRQRPTVTMISCGATTTSSAADEGERCTQANATTPEPPKLNPKNLTYSRNL